MSEREKGDFAGPGPLELRGSDRRRLRGEAHSLKPIVQVGKNGVNPAALREIEEALKAHGLIKVRFVSGQATRREMGQQIAAALGCGLVGIVGHVASFYRPQDETAEG